MLAVKAYDLQQAVQDIHYLLGSKTVVMTVQNGIPWWYFHKEGGSLDGRRLNSLDPTAFSPTRLIRTGSCGCIAYSSAALAAPGIIRHVEGDRFPVGELMV